MLGHLMRRSHAIDNVIMALHAIAAVVGALGCGLLYMYSIALLIVATRGMGPWCLAFGIPWALGSAAAMYAGMWKSVSWNLDRMLAD